MKQSLRRVKANLIARSKTQNLNMSDSENKRAFGALKGHFTRLSKQFDDQLKDFSVDKTELSLKSLQSYLERLQSYEVKVSEKGEKLAMSDDEQTRLYCEKELDDIAEKLSDVQKRFNEVTRKSKTEKGAGLLFSMGRGDQSGDDNIGDVRPIFNRDEGTRGKKRRSHTDLETESYVRGVENESEALDGGSEVLRASVLDQVDLDVAR